MIKCNFVDNEYNVQIGMNPKNLIKKICKTVNNLEHVKGKHILSVIIVSDEKIHEINKEFRGIDRSTDVISFATIDGETSLPLEMGDIFISIDHVNAQAIEYGHSVLREFSFLVTHGIFHLLGYDHQTKEDEEVMFRKQDEVLNKLKIGR